MQPYSFRENPWQKWDLKVGLTYLYYNPLIVIYLFYNWVERVISVEVRVGLTYSLNFLNVGLIGEFVLSLIIIYLFYNWVERVISVEVRCYGWDSIILDLLYLQRMYCILLIGIQYSKNFYQFYSVDFCKPPSIGHHIP